MTLAAHSQSQQSEEQHGDLDAALDTNSRACQREQGADGEQKQQQKTAPAALTLASAGRARRSGLRAAAAWSSHTRGTNIPPFLDPGTECHPHRRDALTAPSAALRGLSRTPARRDKAPSPDLRQRDRGLRGFRGIALSCRRGVLWVDVAAASTSTWK